MTERSGALQVSYLSLPKTCLLISYVILQEDPLYMSYAEIIARSCGEEEEEGDEEEGGEGEEGGASIHVSFDNFF